MSWLFSDHIITFVGGFFVSVWLGRYLGKEKLGIYSYSLALFSIINGVSKLGIVGIGVKEIATSKNKIVSMWTIFVLYFFGASFFYACLMFYTSYAELSELQTFFCRVVGLGVFFTPFDVIGQYYDSELLSKYRVIGTKFGFFTRIALLVIFILGVYPFKYLAFINLIKFITSALLLTYFFKNHASFSGLKFDKNVAKRLLSNSWPLMISSLGAILYLKMDQMMVVDRYSVEEGGLYSVAVTYSGIFYFLSSVLLTSIFPSMVASKDASNNDLYYKNTIQASSLLFYLSIFIIIGTYLFIEYFIRISYGMDFIDSASIIKFHILCLPLVYLGAVLSKWLIIEDLTKFSLLRHGMGLIVNFVLNIILIPKYGGQGAAIASFFALFFSVLVVLIFHPRLRVLGRLFYSGLKYPHVLINKITSGTKNI